MGVSRCSITSLLIPFFFLILLNTLFTPLIGNHRSFFLFPFSLSSIKDNNRTQVKHNEFPANFEYKSFEHKTTSSIKKMISLDRVEEGLAEALASIREAIRSRKYSASGEQENFVPKGSIYRNPYAFHQSHMEMMKKFKVWVYEEGEQPLVHNGPLNDIYDIEGQFIDELDNSKRSPFKARHPDEAHIFSLPLSMTYMVKYVYMPITSPRDYNRDRLHRLVEDCVGVVADKYPYWNRSNGADHFPLSCHDWAPFVIERNPKLFQDFMRVLCNVNISERFQPKKDVSLPEVNVPIFKLGPTELGQHPLNYTILGFFVGWGHGYIQKPLTTHWKDKDSQLQVHECLSKGQNYTKLMGQSKFCLCPSGYEVASPRVVEAINAGRVPVLISQNYSCLLMMC